MTFPCVFVTFPYGVSGKVWYLIVSIPDICLLSFPVNFDSLFKDSPVVCGGSVLGPCCVMHYFESLVVFQSS